MHPDDEKLVRLWADEKITYEDALRRAKSADEVRVEIKLLEHFGDWPDQEDRGPDPIPAPRRPRQPSSPLSSSAEIDDTDEKRDV